MGQDAQAQATINRLPGVSVSVTVTDADGRQAHANLTLKAASLKLTLNGAAGPVIYGTQARLSVNGAGLPTAAPAPAPASDPCAGRTGNTRNPFDECNQVRIDKMAPAAQPSAANPRVDHVLSGGSDPDAPLSPAAAPRYRYIWQSSPGLTFEPGTSDNGQTTVTYDRMGQVKVWCEIHQMIDGAWQTIGETDQATVTVAAPAFALRFTPDNGQARMGQEVRVQIITNPDIPARLIDYRWFDPVSRMEYATNSSHIGFTVKDAKPMPLKALARVPHYGDDIAEITGSYSGQGYDIKISAPRPWGPQLSVWVCDTQLGRAADCGMKPIPPTQFVTFQDIFLEAQIAPVPPTARYRWSIDPSGSCGQPDVAREIRINCSNTGSYTVGLKVYDAENRLLGQAEPRVIRIAINGEAVKKAPQLKTAWENMQQAKQRVNTGQLEEAIELGIAAAQLDPNNAEAKELTPRWIRERQTIRQHLAQAKKALQANRLDDAEKAVDAARKLRPSYPPTLDIAQQIARQRRVDANRPAQIYSVSVKVLGTMVPKSQIEIPPGKIVPLQEVVLGAEITPPPSGNVRYAWKVSEGCTLMGGSGFKVRVQRTEAGICQVEAIARNAEKVKLGQGATSFEVSVLSKPSKDRDFEFDIVRSNQRKTNQGESSSINKQPILGNEGNFDGNYSGEWISEGESSPLSFRIHNGVINGQSNIKGDNKPWVFTGAVDKKGNIRFLGKNYFMVFTKKIDMEVIFTGRIQDKKASGTFSGIKETKGQGAWTAKR